MSRTKLKPKRITDFAKPYRDALAHWSALRNLGFSADEIFFGFGTVSGEPNIIHLQLQTQGKTFTVMVAQVPQSRERVTKTWKQIATMAQASTLEERESCYRERFDEAYFMEFTLAIRAKGILIPELVHVEPSVGQA